VLVAQGPTELLGEFEVSGVVGECSQKASRYVLVDEVTKLLTEFVDRSSFPIVKHSHLFVAGSLSI
jgi:hypothetical protein